MNSPTRSVTLAQLDNSWPEQTISGTRLVQDSRTVTPGAIFVAIGSTGASGHDYIASALDAGAVWVLVDHSVEQQAKELAHNAGRNPDVVVAIPDLAHNVGLIASSFWGNPSSQLKVVGVTGTNGKTSVVQLLCQAWHGLGLTSASIGTLGAGVFGHPLRSTGLTTPSVCHVHELLAEFLAEGVSHVGMELSSHALDQNRVAGVTFAGVAFTNMSRDHLDFHGTMENYAAAKEKIFGLPGNPHVVLNLDDEVGQKWFDAYSASRTITSLSSTNNNSATLVASDITMNAEGLEFDLTSFQGHKLHITSSLLGRFNVDNLLVVCGVLLNEGVEFSQIGGIVSSLEPVFGRMNTIKPYPDSPLVVVDYAHTPDALEQALTTLLPYNFTNIITVFGCTGDRDPGKRPDMARIAEQLSDAVVVTDDDVHWEDGDAIVAHIRAGFTSPEKVVEIRDREHALRHAISHAGAQDVVFIAGKGHEEFLLVQDDKVPFSDTECAKKLLEEKHAGLI